MKYTIEKIPAGQDEVIIRCREVTEEIGRIIEFLSAPAKRLIGMKDGVQTVIDPSHILYIESVDGRTFVYTAEDVLQIDHTLAQLEMFLNTVNFFRCSKSMILNIGKVKALRSLASNRIDVTMQGGEHIMITRTYASDFRKRLKGGDRDD